MARPVVTRSIDRRETENRIPRASAGDAKHSAEEEHRDQCQRGQSKLRGGGAIRRRVGRPIWSRASASGAHARRGDHQDRVRTGSHRSTPCCSSLGRLRTLRRPCSAEVTAGAKPGIGHLPLPRPIPRLRPGDVFSVRNMRRAAKDFDASVGFIPEYIERRKGVAFACVRQSCGQPVEGAALYCPECLARAH